MVDEGEITTNPMYRINRRGFVDTPPPIVTDEQFAAMLKVTNGRDSEDRRDMAILRLLEDTGIRRAECASLMMDDLDLRAMTVTVMGPGGSCTVPFTAQTAEAIASLSPRSRPAALRALQEPCSWPGLARSAPTQSARSYIAARGWPDSSTRRAPSS